MLTFSLGADSFTTSGSTNSLPPTGTTPPPPPPPPLFVKDMTALAITPSAFNPKVPYASHPPLPPPPVNFPPPVTASPPTETPSGSVPASGSGAGYEVQTDTSISTLAPEPNLTPAPGAALPGLEPVKGIAALPTWAKWSLGIVVVAGATAGAIALSR